MSEIPYVAIDDYTPDLAVDSDNHFTGTGALVVPFTMLDISRENHFSYLGNNEHAFASWLPLYDDYYWIFVCKGHLIYDKELMNQGKINLYGQGQQLTTSGAFEFYYSRVKLPFRVDKIKMSLTTLPFTYQSRQARTGKIPGVNLIDYRDQSTLVALDDQNGQYMSDTQTDDLIRLNAGEIIGVDYL